MKKPIKKEILLKERIKADRLPDFVSQDWEEYIKEYDFREKRYKDFGELSYNAWKKYENEKTKESLDSFWEAYYKVDPAHEDWTRGVKYDPKELTDQEKEENYKKWEEEHNKEMEEYNKQINEHKKRFSALNISLNQYNELSESNKEKLLALEKKCLEKLKCLVNN